MKTILLIALAIFVLYFLFEMIVGAVFFHMSSAGSMIRSGHDSPTYWVRTPRIQSQVKYSRV